MTADVGKKKKEKEQAEQHIHQQIESREKLMVWKVVILNAFHWSITGQQMWTQCMCYYKKPKTEILTSLEY